MTPVRSGPAARRPVRGAERGAAEGPARGSQDRPVPAANTLSELGAWDEALLYAELNGLFAADFDLSLLGFSDGELEKLLAYVPEGDGEDGGCASVPPVTIPEPPRNSACRAGDL
ncbi:hypothetical protein [uncultured Paracoccus sp.]|uniref:hypothetical protein n=1 Tax=uncultured Paracoccus sp. TaxID=189685 RepID=UPI00262F61B1|nr:hypothetical protein [uncultured Paracoccus sp.]